MTEMHTEQSINLKNSHDKSADMYTAEDAFDLDLADLTELLNDEHTMISEAIPVATSEPFSSLNLLEPSEQCQKVPEQTKTPRRIKKFVSSKPRFRKGISVKQALLAYDQQPNMSRRPPTNVLIAFPTFDKCDSLVYFSTSLVRHLNSSDIDAATKLLTKYLDKDCKITLHGKQLSEVSFQNYKQMMTVSNELEPDRVMCVHSTKVVENKIMSTIYLKVTDVQSLYTNLSRTSKAFNDEEVLKMGLYADRVKRFQFYVEETPLSNQVAQDLIAYAQREEDVVLYMKIYFTLIVDDKTRKITHFTHAYELTSVHITGTNAGFK